MVVAISASKEWRINSLDFQSAFLQGEDITTNVREKNSEYFINEKVASKQIICNLESSKNE